MSVSTHQQRRLNRATGVALVTLVIGCAAWWFRLGEGISYDWPFAFARPVATSNFLIIAMDEPSYRDLKQDWKTQWDRLLHAQLLRRLKEDGSGPVIFDVFFAPPGDTNKDPQLAAAIADHGRVILGGDLGRVSQIVAGGEQAHPPQTEFLTSAAGWGLITIDPNPDGVIRQHYGGTETDPSLSWAAATLLEASITKDEKQRLTERWIRYYGPASPVPMLSYYSVADCESGFFKDKIILIGGKPITRYAGELVDQFRTPFTRWNGEWKGGVELHTTMLLNLLNNDWLTRLRPTRESAIIILVSVLVGFGLALLKPIPGALAGAGITLSVTIGGILLPLKSNIWFPWAAVAGIVVPGAWLSALASYKNEVRRRASYSEYPEAPPLPVGGTQPLDIAVPEHVLIKRIGRGAYGEVWLGRNRIGLYDAVKVVFRSRFPEGVPYEREFRGIRKYMAISLKHPGLVRLLQVGRNDPAGYFYYVMELGDDETTGADIDPEKYSARNLAKDLAKRGRLSVAETLVLGCSLSEPLEYLHKKGLLHRDIKPSNIIFVDGNPKLADIGLVTDITPREGAEASFVGTEGYVDPDGPSKPSSDIYSFGKVLYEAATGLDRRQFPALPDWLNEENEAVAEFMALNSVILKCCDAAPRKRYQSVAELHEALLDIERRIAKAPAG